MNNVYHLHAVSEPQLILLTKPQSAEVCLSFWVCHFECAYLFLFCPFVFHLFCPVSHLFQPATIFQGLEFYFFLAILYFLYFKEFFQSLSYCLSEGISYIFYFIFFLPNPRIIKWALSGNDLCKFSGHIKK